MWNYAASSLTGSLSSGCISSKCGGHSAGGLTTWLNNPGDELPYFMDICSVPGGCPNTVTGITAAKPPGSLGALDFHFADNVLNDAWPVLASSVSSTGTAAWTNEILGFQLVYGPNPYRFAATYATANTSINNDFYTSEAIGAASQTGKFFMWNSDMLKSLGSTSGSATCDVSSWDCRGDVFVVALK
jgi:hypothetical protein